MLKKRQSISPRRNQLIRIATGGAAMPIGNAIERSHFVYVYDENGRQIRSLFAGNGPGDGLKSFPSTTVNIKRGGFVYSYDADGRQLNATLAQ
jgi:hypothetical protein